MQLSRQPEPNKDFQKEADPGKAALINKLLANRISLAELERLKEMEITAEDLSDIIQRIYDLNEKYILEISSIDAMIRKFDDMKNRKRNTRFYRRISKEFRNLQDPSRKVILAEGDSWFNYPIILTDIIDRIAMEKDFAVYSLASGGDWLLNMLTARHYVEELSVLHPDVFLISGGGNDLVGSNRLAAMLEPSGCCSEYQQNEWSQLLIKNAEKKCIPLDQEKFQSGVQHLSKDFFALLMFFHLQYHFLIGGILRNAMKEGDKFFGIRIITQGYDYPIPSFDKSFGWNPLLWYVPFVRLFLGHGGWLKRPMLMRGIRDAAIQKNILYAMIYLFNEMMIETGKHFNKVLPGSIFHIDSRDSVGKNGWTDELHPRPLHFINTGKVFTGCISGRLEPTYLHVFVVNKFFPT